MQRDAEVAYSQRTVYNVLTGFRFVRDDVAQARAGRSAEKKSFSPKL